MEFFLFTLFIGSFLVQLYLLLYLFPQLLKYIPNVHQKPFKKVSVVIAAHNEKKNLKKLIPLLLKQNHPHFEIIVALDRTSDGSEEYLRSIAHSDLKFITIQQVPEGYNPKKYALTRAIELANYEIILLTDADCYPVSEQWISEMQQCFEDEKTEIVIGFSPYQERQGFLNLFIRYETLLTAIQYLSFGLIRKAYMGVGRNMAYRKSLFKNSGGYSGIENLTGGDDDLFIGKNASSSNVEVCIRPETKMISLPKTTLKSFLRQKVRHQAAGVHYTPANKLKSAAYPASAIILYFSTILLYFYNFNIYYILTIFILRTLVLIIIFALITRRLGETTKWHQLPLLDLSYIFYYIIAGTVAIFSKNVKWT